MIFSHYYSTCHVIYIILESVIVAVIDRVEFVFSYNTKSLIHKKIIEKKREIIFLKEIISLLFIIQNFKN